MMDPPIAAASLQAHMGEDHPITASLGPIDRLICRLKSLEGSKHTLPLGLRVNQIGKLREHLERFRKPLKNLSEMDKTSFRAKWWMKEVRELCYDTEDYLVQSRAGDPHQDHGSGWIHVLLGRIMFWSKPKFMGRVEVLVGIGERSLKNEIEAAISLKKDNKAGISLEEENSADLGIEDELVQLLAFDDHTTQLKMVPIYGFQGAGKMTLARTLYVQYRRKFKCRAFVRVPRNPDTTSLLTSILSQIIAPPPNGFPGVQDLIVTISKHLERKRYFIVIDDVRDISVWDIISRAFPIDNCGSRIILTTQSEDVASACSGYEMEKIYEMNALKDCAETTSEVKNEVLNLTYNNLPLHLKTCLLYLGIYQEGCTITKDDLAKQWVAEGFIAALRSQGSEELSEVPQKKTEELSDVPLDETEEISEVPQDKIDEITEVPQDKTEEISEVPQDKKEEFGEVNQKEKEEIARRYFDELVTRGMIQPVDRNGKGEVLSCTVHHMVLDLIRYRSKEDNFIVVLDNLQSTFRHPDMVRRLSIQFGYRKGASMPVNIMLSQLRSLVFCGFLECVPSIADYGLLRVLMLHIWADEDKIFDLSRVGELYQLRYLRIECNTIVRLPLEIRKLQHLGTLELHAEVVAIPSDIGHLENLMHVRCPSKAHLRDLGELTNLLDLQLTWSTLKNLEEDMECLCSILEKLSRLTCLALVPASRSCSVPARPSRMCISCDSLLIVSPASENLQRIELSRRCCIPSRLPKWIGKLRKLCFLKIAVGNLLTEDIDILKELPALSTLSLHVQLMSAERIVFGKEGFSLLTYFKFTCNVPWLKFEAGAMPNLEKLKLCFDYPVVAEQGITRIIIIERLLSLKEVSAIIGFPGVDAESDWQKAISNDPGNPKMQLMGYIYDDDQGSIMVTREGSGEDENTEADIRVHMKPESPRLRVHVHTAMDPIFLASAAATWALNKLLDHLKDSAIKALLISEGLDREVGPVEDTLRRANLLLGAVPTGSAASGVKIRNEQLIVHVNEIHHHATFLANELDKVKYQCIKEEVKKKNLKNTSLFTSKVKSITKGGSDKLKINRYDIRLIKETADKLEKICNDVHQALVAEKLGQIVEATKNMDIDTRETADNRTETKVFPREEENDIRQKLIAASDQELLVLPIVGDGGVGKTTLAREVYNDQCVRDKFVMRIWIYVSAKFDEVKISQGILQQIPGWEYTNTTNLTVLQGSIKKYLTENFLIVLDDMWEESQVRWDKFLAPLRCIEKKGVILVTTRKLSVAKTTGSKSHINLDGMKKDMFWSFFKRCIFGDENCRADKKLLSIGKEIATKLKGNPLAAKSVGALLRKKCHEHVWRNILDRDEWKTENETDDIIPALRLSYNHLSNHLQQLFSYCALFQKGYRFDKEQLIRMWIALGFVTHERKTLENAGSDSFDELVNGIFFQKEEQHFILHDLMHDVAQEVSLFKCLTIDGTDLQEASQSVHGIRHVGIWTESIWTEMTYEKGSMERSVTFEEKLDKIQNGDILKSLESFMLVGAYDENFCAKLKKTLDQLDYVRLLRLSMHFNVNALESSVTKFIHLRYLELRYTSDERRPLPEAICKLYHLLVLDVKHWSGLDELPKTMNNLVYLRYLLVPGPGSLHSKISRVGEMEFLQELKEFRVQQGNGFEISQLGSLKEIRGSLSVLGLENVKTKQEASKARIKDKKHLRTLSLSWSSSARGNAAVQKEVLEGLKPHDRLAHLHIVNYAGATPSWIAIKDLESIHLQDCTGVEVLPPFEELEFLKKLSLIGMSSLRDVNIDYGSDSGTDSLSCEEDEVELSEVEIARCSALTSIRLNFCKILSKFSVEDCVLLSAIEGLPSSDQRGHYVIQGCPQLPDESVQK